MAFIATRGFLGVIRDVVLRGFGVGSSAPASDETVVGTISGVGQGVRGRMVSLGVSVSSSMADNFAVAGTISGSGQSVYSRISGLGQSVDGEI